MKKLLLILLIVSICVGLVSCEEKYPPVQSNAEELQTVFTLEYNGNKYEVKYELYRALFTSLKSSVDNGDESVWTGENKNEYIEKINTAIIDYASEIYSTFNLCASAEIDVYSTDFETRIDEYIEASVEGGMVNGLLFLGFDGDYQKYLDSLMEDGVNYSVQRLLLRYSLAVDALSEYYIGSDLTDGPEFGKIEYTEDDIRDFYYSNECVRVIYAFLSSDAYTYERACEVRDTIASKTSDDAVASYVVGHTTALSSQDVKFGLLIGRNSLDERYFGEITDAAFELKMSETSSVFELKTGSENGYVIMYRTDKASDFFEERYDSVIDTYLENEFGKILNAEKHGFIKGARLENLLSELDYTNIAPK